jgi:hypothetical protein
MARNHIVGKNKRKGSNKATGRDYSYDKKYESSPEQIRRRASRNAARRRLIASRGKAALRGKDVDHRNQNPLDNRSSNLRVESKKKNRGRKK